MDWQVIILTLGASLITGIISLVGNIIASNSGLKKMTIENKAESLKGFYKKNLILIMKY